MNKSTLLQEEKHFNIQGRTREKANLAYQKALPLNILNIKFNK